MLVGARDISASLLIDADRFFLFLSCYCMESEHRTVYLDNKAKIFY